MQQRKVATKDMYKKPGLPTWAIVVLVIIGLAAVALLVAFFWQRLENPQVIEETPEIVEPANLEETIEESEPEATVPDLENAVYKVREEYPYALKETQEPVDDSYFEDAIFFGDSITTGIPNYLETVYPDMAVVAERGINLYNVLTVEKIRTDAGEYATLLEAAKKYGDRKKIYIMLGGNDLGFEEQVFIKGYKAFIDEVKVQYPNAIIYLQSIPPVTETESQKENYPLSNNADINHYNTLIMELAEKEGLYYLDVATAFMNDEGKLPAEASPDGVHFIGEYYYKWIDYLKKHTVEESK